MKLAIVGTSQHLLEKEHTAISKLIVEWIDTLDPSLIISGGATGVDGLADTIAHELNKPFLAILPKTKTTMDYLLRNRQIAEQCDLLICFTTKRIVTEFCYHHTPKERHQKTAGCYTMNFAANLGKPTKIFVV